MKTKIPRALSLVKLHPEFMGSEWEGKYKKLIGDINNLLYLGEVPNMKGHCVIMNRNTNKTFILHTDTFVEMNKDEI